MKVMEKQFKVTEHFFVDSTRELLVKASSKEEAIQKVKDGDPNVMILDVDSEINTEKAPLYEATLIVERTSQEKTCIKENFRVDFGRAQRDLVDIEYATEEVVRLYAEIYSDLIEDFEEVVREEMEETWMFCEIPGENRVTGFEIHKK